MICYPDSLAYPINDDIPVLLDSEARELSPEEKANRKNLQGSAARECLHRRHSVPLPVNPAAR